MFSRLPISISVFDSVRAAHAVTVKGRLPNCGYGSRDINGLQAAAILKGMFFDFGYRYRDLN